MKITLFSGNFAIKTLLNQIDMAKKYFTPRRKARIYIVSPTLEKMLLSCSNVKDASSISGIEYSNFVKACKLRQDIRISTYLKCASGFGKDVLVVHLPCGYIDAISTVKSCKGNRYYVIDPEDLMMIFMQILRDGNLPIPCYLKSFWSLLTEQKDNSLVKRFLFSVMNLCQELLEENGKE